MDPDEEVDFSIAERYILAGGRILTSLWDTCSSHCLISSAFAAELVRDGAKFARDVNMPMKQGKIWTGTIKSRVFCDITIANQGVVKSFPNTCFYVWDTGRPLALSKAFLKKAGICNLEAAEGDYELLKEHGIRPESKESTNNLANFNSHDLTAEHLAPDGNGALSIGGARAHSGWQGEIATSTAKVVRGKEIGHASNSTRDAWTREKAEALREELKEQMRTPYPMLSQALEKVADEFPLAFGEDITEPSLLKKFKVRLKNGASYVCMVPRRLSEPMLAEVQKQIAALLAQGVIRKSSSPFAFPIVLARRPGSDKIRVCCDFRLLNEMTEPYPYSMPNLHEVLDRLAGKKYYWSVDVSSFFNQIEVEEDSRQYLAFVIPGGAKYEYLRTPFGCKNAPAWAQQQLKESLAENEDTRDLVNFIDDITYGSNSIEDSIEKFRALLGFCVKNKLKLKRSKCVLGVPAVKALGFVLNEQGKWIDPDRVLSLLRIPSAKGVKDVKHLLGAFGFVRQWICGSADICDPLFDLLKKGAKFSWGPRQENALNLLREAATESPCLTQINPSEPVYCRTDASDIGVACVLYQMIKNSEGIELPCAIAYSARRFSPTERRWALQERESYSMKLPFEKFGNMLAGLRVIIETDHKNHLFMWSSKSMKVQRWRMWMQQYDYEVRHLSGKLNAEADSMSRIFEHLHLGNLFVTAPTSEQADRERREGIIAPSTRLQGTSDTDYNEGFEHCNEGDEEEGVDGEGGLDSALFSAHLASANFDHLQAAAIGVLKSNGERLGLPSDETFEALRMQERADWTMFCKEPEDDVLAEAAEATWEESTDQSNFEVSEGALLNVNEVIANEYGIGGVLLQNMGWKPGMYLGEGASAALNVPIERSGTINCREGIGYHAREERPIPTFKECFSKVHNDGTGHVGKIRTYARLRKLPGFPWGLPTSEIYQKVKNECEGCLSCLKIWSTRGKIEGASGAVIRQRPWTEVAIDLVVITEPDIDGNKVILVVIDSFSRAAELFPLKSGDAESVAQCLYDVYNRYGRPVRVRCDRAKAFLKSVMTRFQKLTGVLMHPTLSFSPMQNGQCERANQEVMRHLRAMVLSKPGAQRRWGLLTPSVRRILNNTIHSDTGCSPNELIYGGYGDTEASMFVEDLAHEEGETIAGWLYAKELEEAQFEILKRSELHQEQRLQAAARKATIGCQRVIENGSLVLASRGTSLGGRPKDKLQSRFTGPYLVLNRDQPLDSLVECQHLGSKVVEMFHMHDLVVVNLSHLSEEELESSAMQDHWTYKVLCIEDFRPEGPRKVAKRLRPKSKYEFLVLYDLPRSTEPGDENPAWQPWANVKHLSSLKSFCEQPQVLRELGENFYVSDDEMAGEE